MEDFCLKTGLQKLGKSAEGKLMAFLLPVMRHWPAFCMYGLGCCAGCLTRDALSSKGSQGFTSGHTGPGILTLRHTLRFLLPLPLESHGCWIGPCHNTTQMAARLHFSVTPVCTPGITDITSDERDKAQALGKQLMAEMHPVMVREVAPCTVHYCSLPVQRPVLLKL